MAQTNENEPKGRTDNAHSQVSQAATSSSSVKKQSVQSPDSSQKRGIFARILMFIRQVISELKQVIWPTRNELWTYFWVVIIFVVLLMVAIFLFDTFFSWVTKLVFA